MYSSQMMICMLSDDDLYVFYNGDLYVFYNDDLYVFTMMINMFLQ